MAAAAESVPFAAACDGGRDDPDPANGSGLVLAASASSYCVANDMSSVPAWALDTICARARHDGALTDESLKQLNILFDRSLVSALDLVDHATITRIALASSPSRVFWKVQSTSSNVYHCFSRYCSCQSFGYKVISQGEHLLCKHQLAVRLAEALGVQREQTLADDVWGVELLRGCGEVWRPA